MARDGFDNWVAATVLPPLVPQTSVLVEDREGELLRAYTVADGRWRLALSPDAADDTFVHKHADRL
jgi:penicillin-binding protein 1C